MSMQATHTHPPVDTGRIAWYLRAAVLLLAVIASITIWFTNQWLTERYTIATRSKAELRLALYSGNIVSELQRNSVVPLLLSRDPALIGALNSGDYSATSQRLISYQQEIGSASLILLDGDGRAVATTNRNALGSSHRTNPYFVEALRADDTVFTASRDDTGSFKFVYSRRVESDKRGIGVIVVEVDLKKLESRWRGTSDAVLVTDSTGQVILTTENLWLGLNIEEALKQRSPPNAIQRAIQATADWGPIPPDAYFRGQAYMRQDGRIPFQGWRLVSFTSHAPVRERVNGVLALEIMGFALILALAFYLFSRRAASQSLFFQQESEDLRRLNRRLQQEIAERERVEKTLEVAEQTIAQSSKLAALGEMSAAVSHELNQPLAAMKTYLAGAKLLLQRKRPEEALSSFQRIDDLIERMGSITKQLKSYARKGGEAFEPMDLRASVSSALAMMEPQLKQFDVNVSTALPSEEVMVLADRIRLEQVIINLFRNAIDAMQAEKERKLDILVTVGKFATLAVRDNGTGIDDLDELFEPFYTTKKPGDGVGLGLAISSGIVSDLGGRLTARNAEGGGAVFEVQLPLLGSKTAAAE
ncbi:two-component system sensor histidine kinase [Brevirhabdus pacifica]|uniref:C4-dicarboxylate transport sensor protein DctB n=1 Tax=Brevirhabdus pacifica TaxID=1267768 RepID=A0A1U7DES9_9RHOB|nr:ATP-binding protein [Brevirhabdus pacifica]APX88466.1 two-component system sensor histidine kinase [Brevirhabdus pacifica]OWU79772.1 cytochrome C biogenesis protein CcmE [Loktanella sp. 22II-4b]PJJ87062.1 two-component system C4-dicarboxylate transport sensor histidine kinase DctB [Brevirhabdus pacifica]